MHLDVAVQSGRRIEATLGKHQIPTDQKERHGGAASAPTPFDLFLASLATCATFYVVDFCATRGIPTDGIRLRQTWHRDPETKRISKIEQVIQLPTGFPERYEKAVMRAAGACSVKKHLEQPPQFEISVQHETSGVAAPDV